MSVPENDWIWDELGEFVEYGIVSERKASRLSLEEAHAFILDSDHKRNLAHVNKYGVTEVEAMAETLQESWRW